MVGIFVVVSGLALLAVFGVVLARVLKDDK